MWRGRLQSLQKRPFVGLCVSLTLHVTLIATLVFLGAPFAKIQVKRGEPLFVELPEIPGPASSGNPAAKSVGPAADRPPAPAMKPPPAPRSTPPRPAPAVVASVQPRTTPPQSPPAPSKSLPAPPRSEPSPPPIDTSAPASSDVATPTAAAPEPAPSPPPASSAEGAPSPNPDSARQLAAVAPGAAPPPAPPVDIRSALKRGGGAGGAGNGRAGIEGEPIPLDSPDPRYSDYFDRVRRMIKDRWGYPCVKNGDTRECEYKTAMLVVEFGIAKDGKVPFVNVLRSSGWAIYDDYAVNAIKLAAPFPPVPDAISRKGIPVLARFNYVVDTSLTNFLR